MKKIISGISIFFIALLAGVVSSPTAHAATGFYLNPSSGSYASGSSFTVQLRIADDTPGVQANLTFDKTKLQVTSISKQGSGFENNTVNTSNADGTITVYAINGGFDGNSDQLIATFTFQAINGGEAPLTFTGTNRTLRYVLLAGFWYDAPTNNASYTITGGSTPPPVNPPSGGGTTNQPKPIPSAPKPGTSTPIPNPTSPATPSTPASPTSPIQETPSGEAPATSDVPSEINTPSIVSPSKPTQEKQQSLPPVTTPPSDNLFLWIVGLVAAVAGSLVLIGWLLYRKSHMSKALQRLIATVIEYRIALNEQAASLHPALTTPIVMPKLLGFTAPKLLGSGIKQKLLTATSKIPGVDRFISR